MNYSKKYTVYIRYMAECQEQCYFLFNNKSLRVKPGRGHSRQAKANSRNGSFPGSAA